MLLALLLVIFFIAAAVSVLVVRAFSDPLDRILKRIIADEISLAWLKYMKFAILVVGVSAGVRIHQLEKYITPVRGGKDLQVVELTQERWIVEIYRTIIDSLQGIAWLLLVFFAFALVAYVIVKIAELKRSTSHEPKP